MRLRRDCSARPESGRVAVGMASSYRGETAAPLGLLGRPLGDIGPIGPAGDASTIGTMLSLLLAFALASRAQVVVGPEAAPAFAVAGLTAAPEPAGSDVGAGADPWPEL